MQCDTRGICTSAYKTSVRGHLLHYWATTTDDVGRDWAFEGAPAGLECDTSAPDGVFQLVDKDEDIVELRPGDEAFDTLEGYLQKGYLERYDSLAEVRLAVEGEPILSKLGCIKKAKFNPDTGQTTYKMRIILDCKRSLISRSAQGTHKAALPRVTDAVKGASQLMQSNTKLPQPVTRLVADIVDAFWLIPLKECERKYFVARLRNRYFVFLRIAQGSRGAPLTFAAITAVAARWIQSLNDNIRLQVYVDDPLAFIRGTPEQQIRTAVSIVIAWTVLGFPMASHKAVFGETAGLDRSSIASSRALCHC